MRVLNGLLRWLAVVVIGLATCWPAYGIAALSWQWFPAAPLPILVGDLLWAVVLCLALPLTLHWFRLATVVAIDGICLVVLWWAYSAARFTPNLSEGILVLAFLLFFAFGWWKIATPLWRWANGIVAVQQTGAEHEGGHGG